MSDAEISAEMTSLRQQIQDRATRMDGIELEARAAKRAGEGGKAERLMSEWRSELQKNKAAQARIQELEIEVARRGLRGRSSSGRTFVNSYGEATTRRITTPTYEKAQRAQEKRIRSLLGWK